MVSLSLIFNRETIYTQVGRDLVNGADREVKEKGQSYHEHCHSHPLLWQDIVVDGAWLSEGL